MSKTLPWLDDRLAANGNTVQDNFSAWFGTSKAVDNQGQPLTLYHGTNQAIDSFCTDRLGASTQSVSSRLGFWFSDHPQVASDYADKAARQVLANVIEHEKRTEKLLRELERAERKGDWDKADALTIELESHELDAIRDNSGANVLPVYLAIEHPHYVDSKGVSMSVGQCAEIIEQARENGHDGVVFLNSTDTASNTLSNHYVVFEPAQIKSALGNAGLYLKHSECLTDKQAHERMTLAAQALAEVEVSTRRVVCP